MTSGQYREHPPGLLSHPSLHTPPNPVIRMLDMSSNNRLENTTNYQTHSPSPRDGNSPPGLHVPNGNHSLSSKVLTLELSHRPNLSPTHHLQPLLQPAHQLTGSPHKDCHYTPLTTMAVPGFPPSMGTFSQAVSGHQDPFSALNQLGQDLRLQSLAHPNITQWLQQVQD